MKGNFPNFKVSRIRTGRNNRGNRISQIHLGRASQPSPPGLRPRIAVRGRLFAGVVADVVPTNSKCDCPFASRRFSFPDSLPNIGGSCLVCFQGVSGCRPGVTHDMIGHRTGSRVPSLRVSAAVRCQLCPYLQPVDAGEPTAVTVPPLLKRRGGASSQTLPAHRAVHQRVVRLRIASRRAV